MATFLLQKYYSTFQSQKNNRRPIMKIAYCSDLHLEFGPLELKNEKDADILILAGDICVESSDFPMGFFENISKEFPLIFYVLGNH
jgi:predicted phosphodiesterase